MGFSLLPIFRFHYYRFGVGVVGRFALQGDCVFAREREGSKALKRDLGLPPNVCGRPQGHRPRSNCDTRLLSDWHADVYPS